MVNQTPHCRFDLLRADTNVQECSSTCIKRTAGNERMDDRLTCGRNVPGSTRQTNALSFYSLGNEVDKGRSRTAPLIYKSIVIGSTDKFGTTILTHLFCPHFGGKSSTEHHSASGFPPRSDEKSTPIWQTSFYQRFLESLMLLESPFLLFYIA